MSSRYAVCGLPEGVHKSCVVVCSADVAVFPFALRLCETFRAQRSRVKHLYPNHEIGRSPGWAAGKCHGGASISDERRCGRAFRPEDACPTISSRASERKTPCFFRSDTRSIQARSARNHRSAVPQILTRLAVLHHLDTRAVGAAAKFFASGAVSGWLRPFGLGLGRDASSSLPLAGTPAIGDVQAVLPVGTSQERHDGQDGYTGLWRLPIAPAVLHQRARASNGR